MKPKGEAVAATEIDDTVVVDAEEFAPAATSKSNAKAKARVKSTAKAMVKSTAKAMGKSTAKAMGKSNAQAKGKSNAKAVPKPSAVTNEVAAQHSQVARKPWPLATSLLGLERHCRPNFVAVVRLSRCTEQTAIRESHATGTCFPS